MTDVERIAKRLMGLAQLIGQQASTYGFQTGPRVQQLAPGKTAIDEISERCIGKLDDAEREELDRMIEKMALACW